MMIHDDNVALHPAPAHLGDEAALPLAALLPDAGLGTGVQLGPERAGLGKLGKFRAVPGRGGLLPRRNRAILLNLFQSAQHGLIGEVVELFAAQIIVAAFHVTDREAPVRTFAAGSRLSKQRLLEKWNVR